MAASRAYIAGMGTTGVLVGFALLTLAVFGGLLAFRGRAAEGIVHGPGPLGAGGGRGAAMGEVAFGGRSGDGSGGRAARNGAAPGRAQRTDGRTGSDLIGAGGAVRGESMESAPVGGQGGPKDSVPTQAAPAPRTGASGGGSTPGLGQ